MTARKRLSLSLHSANAQGFTLIELLIVIMIIAILAGTASMLYVPMRRKACTAIARYDLRKFYEAEQVYLSEKNEFLGNVGDIISNAPGIKSTMALPDYEPTKNTYITITKIDPFTAEAKQFGVPVVFECDIRTGTIRER